MFYFNQNDNLQLGGGVVRQNFVNTFWQRERSYMTSEVKGGFQNADKGGGF